MELLVINGSPHRSGNTARLLKEVMNGAAEGGMQVTEFFADGKTIRACRGCDSCVKNHRCIIRDDILSHLLPILYLKFLRCANFHP